MNPEPNSRSERPPSSSEPPVARLVSGRPKVRLKLRDPEPTAPDRLERRTLSGWAVSLSLHAMILLILGLWMFTPPTDPERTIVGNLAGTELGDDQADAFEGALGLDTPLIMPETPALEVPSFRPLQTMVKVDPDPSVVPPRQNVESLPLPPSSAARGEGGGFGVARFGRGTENVQGVAVQVGDPQFTLIWEGNADLDLHVEEPGGSHISWKLRKGERGGRLDVDKRTAPGPENVFWVQGDGPEGVYKWFVYYYGPEPFQRRFGGAVRWRVRVKHSDQVTEYGGTLKAIDDRSEIHTFQIDRGK